MAAAWLSHRQGTALMRWLRIIGLVVGFAPGAAMAHAYLEKAVPAQRAVVFSPPERVQLWFNERLEPAFSSLSVVDAADKAVDQGDAKVAPDNPKLLSVGL